MLINQAFLNEFEQAYVPRLDAEHEVWECVPDYDMGKQLVKEYVTQMAQQGLGLHADPKECVAGETILTSASRVQIAVLMASFSRSFLHLRRSIPCLKPLRKALLRRHLPFTPQQITVLCQLASRASAWLALSVVGSVELFLERAEITPELRCALETLRAARSTEDSEGYQVVFKIDELLKQHSGSVLQPDEPWAQGVLADLAAMTSETQAAWNAILAHAITADAVKPSKKWLTSAKILIDVLGKETCLPQITAWLVLFTQTRFPNLPQYTYEEYERWREYCAVLNHNYLAVKGLVWCCQLFDEPAVVRLIGDVGLAAFKKIPSVGAKSAKVGNACVQTLAAMSGLEPVAQLSRLKMRVQYPVALKLIETALNDTAARENLPPEELEELAVPTFGMEEVGCRREDVGEFVAEILVNDKGKAELSSTVPALIKNQHGDVLKELKGVADEITKALPIQRERLERLILVPRSWTLDLWRERYCNHPLVGILARRLLWQFEQDERSAVGIWDDERIVDETGTLIEWLTSETCVRLWHPLGVAPERVLAWRRRLEDLGVTQPFKQAHREVYLLTDAERTTETYSNRFASHLILQHQFAALCRQRGWRFHLIGHFNGGDSPSISLPQYQMTVKLEIYEPGGDMPRGTGVFPTIVTGAVRFSRADGLVLSLTDVPALIFSEVMRDVDLFVGVCSIGIDPTWGTRATHADMIDAWTRAAFGDLSATAQTRKDVLSRLIPRLKITERCSLEGKFMWVRGDLRTYKIHLGSGNILMEPNDQYLCIVGDSQEMSKQAKNSVLLPFEGDQMLALILSKAFLLADDRSIKDATITRQL